MESAEDRIYLLCLCLLHGFLAHGNETLEAKPRGPVRQGRFIYGGGAQLLYICIMYQYMCIYILMIYVDLDGDEHPFTSYLDVHQGLHRALTVHAPVMAMVGMFVMVVCKKMSSYL